MWAKCGIEMVNTRKLAVNIDWKSTQKGKRKYISRFKKRKDERKWEDVEKKKLRERLWDESEGYKKTVAVKINWNRRRKGKNNTLIRSKKREDKRKWVIAIL